MKRLRSLATIVATYLYSEAQEADNALATAPPIACPQCHALDGRPYRSEPCEDDDARRHISLRCDACGYLWFMQC